MDQSRHTMPAGGTSLVKTSVLSRSTLTVLSQDKYTSHFGVGAMTSTTGTGASITAGAACDTAGAGTMSSNTGTGAEYTAGAGAT